MVMDFLPPATQDHLMQKNIKHSEEILKFYLRKFSTEFRKINFLTDETEGILIHEKLVHFIHKSGKN